MSWDIDSLEYYVALLKKNSREQKAPYVVLGESRVRTVNKCHHFKEYVDVCVQRISLKNTMVKRLVSREEVGLWK